MRTSNTRRNGFTLIEVVVVVAIIGIIAGIAWPIFNQESMKNRRTQAISALTRIANELEEYHSDKLTYVNYDTTAPYSQSYAKIIGSLTLYTVSLGVPTATTFTVTATAIGAQAKDTDCATLSIDQNGIKSFTGNATSSVARCWGSAN
jgi:type IV pilus assembly protein PilE